MMRLCRLHPMGVDEWECRSTLAAAPLPCSPPLLALPPRVPPPQKAGWGCGKEQLVELRAFKRRLSGYASCGEALMDEFLRPGLLIGG